MELVESLPFFFKLFLTISIQKMTKKLSFAGTQLAALNCEQNSSNWDPELTWTKIISVLICSNA